MMSGRDDVLRQIEQAFADACMPRTEDEITGGGIDGPYVIKHFLGKTREDVETQDFLASLYMEDVTDMTDGAVPGNPDESQCESGLAPLSAR